MFIVGELMNSTCKAVAQALTSKDKKYLQNLAVQQAEAGAQAIDINAAAAGNEIENIQWLVDIVQEVVDIPLCIDSPSAVAIEAGLARCHSRAVLNSITAETQRWQEVLPLVVKYKAKVIALCMEDGGLPETVDDRLRVARKLVTGLVEVGVAEDDIYLDPLIKPLGINHNHGVEALETTRVLRGLYPNVHVISGLSNISFGLPERRLLNRAFMAMSVCNGMDAFILDPLDEQVMSLLTAAQVLAGQDEYCLNFISGVREGKVKG